MFETEWHGIEFSSIAKLSSQEVAGPDFYRAFYDEFFLRYETWDALSPAWRREKELAVNLVLSRVPTRARILSVGCGLGYMEHQIRARAPEHDLYVHDVTRSAWRWLEKEVGEDRMYIGRIPDCLPPRALYDMVYLSAVDYAMSDAALVALLSAIRTRLADGVAGSQRGQCMIISASLQPTPANAAQRIRRLASRTKASLTAVLDRIGARSRGQLWGWARTRAEYRAIMLRAGFQGIEDGFVSVEERTNYWIAGK